MIKTVSIFFVLLLFSFPSHSRNAWESQQNTVKAAPEVIGTYSLGCLIGAEALEQDGYGWQTMRPSRNRFYAHPQMKAFLTRLAKTVKDDLKSILIIGDLGLPKGGPFSSGHRSHQVGLDADLWFHTPPAAKKRSLSNVEREQISAVNMVDHRKKQPSKHWNSRYHKYLLRAAAQQNEVDRIFVNPVIKRELCRTDKGAEWLGKIRPWNGHDYHFHVRLKCPAGDKSCTQPEGYEPIKGDGCDDTLEWWFRKPTKAEIEEWKIKEAEMKKKPKPKLPPRCLKLLD